MTLGTREQLREERADSDLMTGGSTVLTINPRGLERLLVATDGAPAADGALRVAGLIADRTGAAVRVLSVIEPGSGPRDGRSVDALIDQVESRFERVRDQLRAAVGARPEWRSTIDTGSACETICSDAEAAGSDLIVMGFGQHRRAGDRAPDRATLQRIPELSTRPVLVIPASARALPARAMLALDFSRASIRAGHAALQVMAAPGVMHLVYVHMNAEPFPAEPRDAAASYAAGFATFFEAVERELHPPPGISFERVVLPYGDATSELSAYAAANEIELIAMGKHGKATHERFQLGSVSAGLLRSAQCAVVVSGDGDGAIDPQREAGAPSPHEGIP